MRCASHAAYTGLVIRTCEPPFHVLSCHIEHPHSPVHAQFIIIFQGNFPSIRTMSQSRLITTPSSRYQAIFDYALETYRKRTGEDLISHPLHAKLESCHSPADILTVLRQQLPVLDPPGIVNDRLTTLLDSTVTVLNAFSATIGGTIGLVSLRNFR